MRYRPEHDVKLLAWPIPCCSRIPQIHAATSLVAHNTAGPDAVLPAVEKLTDRNTFGSLLSALHPDTGALSIFCRNVSFCRCVDWLPPAIRHVEVLRLLLHVYVWEDRVGGIFSRCRRCKAALLVLTARLRLGIRVCGI